VPERVDIEAGGALTNWNCIVSWLNDYIGKHPMVAVRVASG